MKLSPMAMLLAATLLAGCSSAPPPEPPPPLRPQLGRAVYWYARPSVASVDGADYDRLWDACADVARQELFSIDLQNYREGMLTTQPLVSKQIFEFWRPDTGDVHQAIQNSLQLIRRTIRFEFIKTADGYRVTPKVLVERFAQPGHRVTSPSLYQTVFTYKASQANETGGTEKFVAEHWYAIGRDSAMEKQLAQAISDRMK